MSRVLVYNIAYATGAPNSLPASILNISRHFLPTRFQFNKISRFINSTKADIVGLIEVDTGSYRTSSINQVEKISNYLSHYSHGSTKYGDSISGKIIPILRKQGNAILTREKQSNGVYHYFPGGFKKLIIELDMGTYRFFLLHLSLSKRVRKMQLQHMANLLSTKKCPVIIAGDFNTFSGTKEINYVQNELGLVNPNVNNLPTFPAWKPKHQLDFILCSKEIKVTNFEVPDIKLSDHLPVLMDFEIQ
ncbi:MAG TPA: endonuclease/exonuclease/phosphatase family protein [Victivallales bacterium]|nr:endonuclease/exonuclease/phosphatase family protein [Victivallales bacterium]